MVDPSNRRGKEEILVERSVEDTAVLFLIGGKQAVAHSFDSSSRYDQGKGTPRAEC